MRAQAQKQWPERELRQEVPLATPAGLLVPEAVGWSRQPLHRTDLGRGWGRRKRWEYWAVLGERAMFAITLADFDYVGMAAVSLLEYSTFELTERALLTPLAAGLSMPEQLGERVVFDALGLHVKLHRIGSHTQLSAAFGSGGQRLAAELLVEHPKDQESLSVVIPWSAERYQYTSKHVGLPVHGTVTLGRHRYDFGGGGNGSDAARAVLDHGRGRWPRQSAWIWACAAQSPAENRRAIGFNLGGRWTDGTGLSENGLFIDGRVEKLSEELTFEFDPIDWQRPWQIRAPTGRLELRFTPLHRRHVGALPRWAPLGARLDWRLGRYNGILIRESGERIEVRDMLGWAEDLSARW